MRLVLAWIAAVGLLVSHTYQGPAVQAGVVHGVVVDGAGNALSGVLVELTAPRYSAPRPTFRDGFVLLASRRGATVFAPCSTVTRRQAHRR